MMHWHIDDVALTDWCEHRETAAQAASVETHLLACERCRDRVREAHVPGTGQGSALDLAWGRIRSTIQTPRPSLVERGLRRLGLSAADARLVAAADAFRGPWLMGVLTILAFVVLAAEFGRSSGQAVFLAVAPILPSLAVALSYDPSVERALEQELITPYPRVRLVLLRTIAVLVMSVPIVLAIGVIAPVGAPFLWLLPAVGFVAVVLALSTWTDPLWAVAAVGGFWVGVVLVTAHATSVAAMLHGPYRITYVAVGAVSAGVFALRLRHLRELRTGRAGL